MKSNLCAIHHYLNRLHGQSYKNKIRMVRLNIESGSKLLGSHVVYGNFIIGVSPQGIYLTI